MAVTPDVVEAFVRATKPPGGDWYGKCAGLTYRTMNGCGGYTPDIYGSAWLAYLAARAAGRVESLDWRKAPPGAVHYWDYVDPYGNRYGHVTLDIYGAGTDTLSATHHAHEYWNVSAGLISVPAQTARGMKYLGWARTYGARNILRIHVPSTGGGGDEPLDPIEPVEKEEAMQVFGYIKPSDPNRTTYVIFTFEGGLWKETVSNDAEYGPSIAYKWGDGAPKLSLGDRNDLLARFQARWPDLPSAEIIKT